MKTNLKFKVHRLLNYGTRPLERLMLALRWVAFWVIAHSGEQLLLMRHARQFRFRYLVLNGHTLLRHSKKDNILCRGEREFAVPAELSSDVFDAACYIDHTFGSRYGSQYLDFVLERQKGR